MPAMTSRVAAAATVATALVVALLMPVGAASASPAGPVPARSGSANAAAGQTGVLAMGTGVRPVYDDRASCTLSSAVKYAGTIATPQWRFTMDFAGLDVGFTGAGVTKAGPPRSVSYTIPADKLPARGSFLTPAYLTFYCTSTTNGGLIGYREQFNIEVFPPGVATVCSQAQRFQAAHRAVLDQAQLFTGASRANLNAVLGEVALARDEFTAVFWDAVDDANSAVVDEVFAAKRVRRAVAGAFGGGKRMPAGVVRGLALVRKLQGAAKVVDGAGGIVGTADNATKVASGIGYLGGATVRMVQGSQYDRIADASRTRATQLAADLRQLTKACRKAKAGNSRAAQVVSTHGQVAVAPMLQATAVHHRVKPSYAKVVTPKLTPAERRLDKAARAAYAAVPKSAAARTLFRHLLDDAALAQALATTMERAARAGAAGKAKPMKRQERAAHALATRLVAALEVRRAERLAVAATLRTTLGPVTLQVRKPAKVAKVMRTIGPPALVTQVLAAAGSTPAKFAKGWRKPPHKGFVVLDPTASVAAPAVLAREHAAITALRALAAAPIVSR